MFLKIVSILLLYFSLTLSCSASTYSSIEYNIDCTKLSKGVLTINAIYRGDFNKSEELQLPTKYGNAEYDINILKASSKYHITDVGNNKVIKISNSNKKKEFTIEYTASVLQGVPAFDLKELFIDKNLVHTLGHAIFVTPLGIEYTDEIDFNIQWFHINDHWSVVSSHGEGRKLNFSSTIYNLLDAVYVAGDIKLDPRKIGRGVVTICTPKQSNLKNIQLVNSIANIIKNQRRFFDDWDFDEYLVFCMFDIDDDKESAFMGGINLYKSFTSYVSKSISFEQYHRLFSHEHLHNWIGRKIVNSEEELNYWWSEGFTDYYSRAIDLNESVLNTEEFAHEINTILAEYYNSEYINISNALIAKDFWNNYKIRRIPYLRGFIFALYLNCRLYKNNQNTDFILKTLLHTHENTKFSNHKFIKIIEESSRDINIDEIFSRIIIRGENIDLSCCSGILPLYKEQNHIQEHYELSFDSPYHLNMIKSFFVQYQSHVER